MAPSVPPRAAAAQPAPARPEAAPLAAFDREATTPTTEQFQDVDASVVPVPIESLNRLVIAVDELGSEMSHVRQAIRDLTAALSDSQTNLARALSVAQAGHGTPEGPDPLDAVTGPYVSGEPTPTPFSAPAPTPAAGAPAPTATHAPMPASASTITAPMPTVAPPYGSGFASDPTSGLGDLPIVSTGAVQMVIGPIVSLDELDDAVEHIRRIGGVESVAVTSFDGPNVVLTADLSRALPLASLLRHELGREVVSCRNVDGRIVVDFGEAGPRA